ncbi:MAG: sigma-54-dependent transcriptional regulator, partial [Opitutaceae bacterium]
MNSGAKVLLIEDDPGIADTVRRVLADEGHEVAVRRRGDEGLAYAVEEPVNVVVTDLRIPGVNGLELIRRLRTAQPRLPVILITAFGTTDTAIEATKFGAFDYLVKPFAMPQLIELVRKAADSNRLMSEPVFLGESGAVRDALVGHSEAMQMIYKEIGRVASKPVTVLIRGETGT